MSFLTYTTGIPASNDNPSNNQPNMLTNTNSVSTFAGTDHYGFNSSLGGWHNIIHIPQVTGNTDPSPTTSPANAGQMYTKTISGDLQLIYQSSGGVITQLTGGAAPSPGTNGYVYLDGGILLQWGKVNGTHGSKFTFDNGDTGTVTFATSNIAFPNNCFTVQTTMGYSTAVGNPPEIGNVAIGTGTGVITKTGFGWTYPQNSNVYTSFFWWAIGN